MTKFSHVLLAGWMIGCLCVGSVLAALRICDHCGREGDHAEQACMHCGYQFPEHGPDAPALQPDTSQHVALASSRLHFAGEDAAMRLDQEWALVEQLFHGPDPWLCLLHVQNTRALATAAGVLFTDERSTRAVAIADRCRQAIWQDVEPCTMCDGSGLRILETRTISGELIRQKVPGSSCLRCDGHGVLAFFRAEGDVQRARRQAETFYGDLQRDRGWQAVGRGWVPPTAILPLAVTVEAAFLQRLDLGCRRCTGGGRVQCRQCRGRMVVPCPERRCHDGFVVVARSGELTGDRQRRRCQTCGGKGQISCAGCAGRGFDVCADCSGAGAAPVCRSCDGAGWLPCRRCSGSGTHAGVSCRTCGMQGRLLCAACQGYGVRP